MSKKTYKTVWVRAEMGAEVQNVTKKRQIGTKKVFVEKGFFGGKSVEIEEPVFEDYEERVLTGKLSDTFIDIAAFAQKIMDACNLLADEGYEVMHISDVIDGRYNFATMELQNKNAGVGQGSVWAGGWGYGYGYSVTDGAIVTAPLRNVA